MSRSSQNNHSNVFNFFFGGKSAKYNNGKKKTKPPFQNGGGWQAHKLRSALKSGQYKDSHAGSFLGHKYSK